MFSISVLIPIVLAGLIFLYLFLTYSYWYRNGVIQDNPFRIFGGIDFTLCRQNYVTLYSNTYNKHKDGPFQGVYQLLKPSLFLRDPDLIKDVILNKSKVFPDTGSQVDEAADPVISGDPFFQSGQKWKDSRTRFSSLGTPARLRAILPFILQVCTPMNEYIKNLQHESGKGDGTDTKELVNKFITDSLISVLLGGNANSFSTEQSIFQEIGKAVFEDNIVQNLGMLMIIGAPHLARFLKLRIIPKKTADLLTRLIKEEVSRRKQTGEVRPDLFDHLLKKTENDSQGGYTSLSENSLRIIYSEGDQCPARFQQKSEFLPTKITLKGFESSSLVAAFTFLNLAKNQGIQENLRRSIRERAPPGTKLTEEAVTEIPLLTNCILETLRLDSPVTLLQRKTNEDFTLKASTGEEVFLEKGRMVLIPVCGLHQDERVFPNPKVFDPDRFDHSEQRHYFLGFGDGPRLCLGQRYALQSISVLIASIIRDFQVEIGSKMKLPMKFSSHPFFLYPADGIWLRFVPL